MDIREERKQQSKGPRGLSIGAFSKSKDLFLSADDINNSTNKIADLIGLLIDEGHLMSC